MTVAQAGPFIAAVSPVDFVVLAMSISCFAFLGLLRVLTRRPGREFPQYLRAQLDDIPIDRYGRQRVAVEEANGRTIHGVYVFHGRYVCYSLGRHAWVRPKTIVALHDETRT